jgi:hypothetical protein
MFSRWLPLNNARAFKKNALILLPFLFSVWDVQSLVSINPRDRKQYVRAVRSLLKVRDEEETPSGFFLS